MTTDLINNRTAERHDFLWGVFVTALEGGINYWARVWEYRPGYDIDPTPKEWSDYLDFNALIQCDTIDPRCPDDEGQYRVTIEVIEKGIKALKSGEAKVNSTILGWIVEGDNENDAGNIDADAADCIVQAGLFGEVVYG